MTLHELAERSGVTLSAEADAALTRFLELLERWGRRINLTADPRPEAVTARQLPDAFELAALLAPGRVRAVDAGAGAGLVGIPLAVLRPELELTLVEANQRKCAFLRAAVHELGLAVEVAAMRFEAIQERFALALSRATWAPERWLEEAERVLEPEGRIVVFSRDAPALPNHRRLDARQYRLEDGAERWVSIWRKA